MTFSAMKEPTVSQGCCLARITTTSALMLLLGLIFTTGMILLAIE